MLLRLPPPLLPSSSSPCSFYTCKFYARFSLLLGLAGAVAGTAPRRPAPLPLRPPVWEDFPDALLPELGSGVLSQGLLQPGAYLSLSATPPPPALSYSTLQLLASQSPPGAEAETAHDKAWHRPGRCQELLVSGTFIQGRLTGQEGGRQGGFLSGQGSEAGAWGSSQGLGLSRRPWLGAGPGIQVEAALGPCCLSYGNRPPLETQDSVAGSGPGLGLPGWAKAVHPDPAAVSVPAWGPNKLATHRFAHGLLLLRGQSQGGQCCSLASMDSAKWRSFLRTWKRKIHSPFYSLPI